MIFILAVGPNFSNSTEVAYGKRRTIRRLFMLQVSDDRSFKLYESKKKHFVHRITSPADKD